MITLRPSAERGRSRFDWLDSYHTFSFGGYHDRNHMGFGPLRVINDDYIDAMGGFDMHGHRDMEIITYVLEGALEHKDSLGNGDTILPGDVQRMSAGTGIMHSEFNPSPDQRVHLLQIWIMPDKSGHQAGYEQKHFMPEDKHNRFRLVASKDGREGSVSMNQDASMYAATLSAGANVAMTLDTERLYWVHVARGEAVMNGTTLKDGDSAGITGEQALAFSTDKTAEILLFDLPK